MEKRYITSAIYSFRYGWVSIKKPFEIVKETEKCYFTEHSRYLKSEMNIPMFKSPTCFPYVEIAMIDADESTLRNKLSEWFSQEADRVLNNISILRD